MPGSDEGGVAAHLIADEHRLVEHHGVDRHGRASPSPALRRQTASGEIHLGEQPPPKMSPFGLASAGIAMTRTSGRVEGSREALFPAGPRFIAGSRGASISNVNKISRDGEGGQ